MFTFSNDECRVLGILFKPPTVTGGMALCIPSNTKRMTSVVFVDEDTTHHLSWQLDKADRETTQAKKCLTATLTLLIIQSASSS